PKHSRIAQLILEKATSARIEVCKTLSPTERDAKGFGSTNTTTATVTPVSPAMLRFQGQVKGHSISVLIDSGATGNYIRSSLVKGLKILTEPLEEPYDVNIADGTTYNVKRRAIKLPVNIDGNDMKLSLNLLALKGHDIILGKTWLTTVNP